MSRRPGITEVRARTYKVRDAWWTVLLVDPVASRLVQLAAPYRWLTPNRLTLLAFALGLGAAACFARGGYAALAAGALLFHASFVVDCMDGKIARLNGTGSEFGAWLDYVFDRLRVLACAAALFGGQYARTGALGYLALAGAVIFLDMFRYLDALMMQRVNSKIRKAARGLAQDHRDDTAQDARPPADSADDPGAVDIYRPFRDRLSMLLWARDLLLRHRIRTHVFSGIEFQMAVFIVGPLTGAIAAVTVGASVLLVAFEIFLIVKLYAATKVLDGLRAALREPPPAPAPAVPRQRDGELAGGRTATA
ncbi:MAG TPA: CDP-alcohol phosphatidyltransferase family protein [Pilimelia sp.]|nr:CDP-alcohol phosphatidyltransferase family protein [Pilimelia sp.]